MKLAREAVPVPSSIATVYRGPSFLTAKLPGLEPLVVKNVSLTCSSLVDYDFRFRDFCLLFFVFYW